MGRPNPGGELLYILTLQEMKNGKVSKQIYNFFHKPNKKWVENIKPKIFPKDY